MKARVILKMYDKLNRFIGRLNRKINSQYAKFWRTNLYGMFHRAFQTVRFTEAQQKYLACFIKNYWLAFILLVLFQIALWMAGIRLSHLAIINLRKARAALRYWYAFHMPGA